MRKTSENIQKDHFSSGSSDEETPRRNLSSSGIMNRSTYGSREFSKFKNQAESALQKGKISYALAKYQSSNTTLRALLNKHRY